MSRRFVLAVLAAVVAGAAPLRSQSADTGAFTMALTGDSIITRRISVYAEPEHTRLFELIRGADAAFTNLEMLFHDYSPTR